MLYSSTQDLQIALHDELTSELQYPKESMLICDTLIRNAIIVDGTGAAPELLDISIRGDRICDIAARLDTTAAEIIEADGLTLAPGFIDVHTHDDTAVIANPAMLPKLSRRMRSRRCVQNCMTASTREPSG
jgi:N-acyl-D-aspartate/D-glutamate deacylase